MLKSTKECRLVFTVMALAITVVHSAEKPIVVIIYADDVGDVATTNRCEGWYPKD